MLMWLRLQVGLSAECPVTNTDLRDVVVKNGLHVGGIACVDNVEASAI